MLYGQGARARRSRRHWRKVHPAKASLDKTPALGDNNSSYCNGLSQEATVLMVRVHRQQGKKCLSRPSRFARHAVDACTGRFSRRRKRLDGRSATCREHDSESRSLACVERLVDPALDAGGVHGARLRRFPGHARSGPWSGCSGCGSAASCGSSSVLTLARRTAGSRWRPPSRMRRHGPAGSAPRRPEIDQEGNVALGGMPIEAVGSQRHRMAFEQRRSAVTALAAAARGQLVARRAVERVARRTGDDQGIGHGEPGGRS